MDVRRVDTDGDARTWIVTTTIHCTAVRHDTKSAYKNDHCRCPAATRDAVGYEKRRASGLVIPNQPATMTRRRLQALAVIGWTSTTIAEHTGRNPVSISQIRRGEHDTVTGQTAHAVLRVYRQLHDQPGPSDRSRKHAARHGWTGPSPILAFLDIDEVAVDLACAGEVVPLHRGERLEAVRRLHTAGHGYRQIADRLRVAQRQVHRDLVDLELVAREQVAS